MSLKIDRSTNVTYDNTIAWATISSISVTGTTAAFTTSNDYIRFQVGTSSSIGFSNVVLSTADIYKLIEATEDNPTDSNVQVDVSNGTSNALIRFENAPNDSRDYKVWYINRRSRR